MARHVFDLCMCACVCMQFLTMLTEIDIMSGKMLELKEVHIILFHEWCKTKISFFVQIVIICPMFLLDFFS